MTINATAAILLALYAAAARRQGVMLADAAGTVQNDILKEYIARGTYIYPPRPSLRIVTDVFAFCAREMPQWNTISISGYHIREAGSTAVQEIAFTLANGIAYVDAAVRAGLDVNAFGQRLSFFFNCHNNFLEEIAKFRAARRLWAHIMRDRFGATNPRAQQLRFHTQTAGSTLSAQQPENNIVRVALQAMAAVLGGTQSLHCNRARRGAVAAQRGRRAPRPQNTADHRGRERRREHRRSGRRIVTIEAATDRLEAEARVLLERIERVGGTLPAIESGMIQREIQDAAYRAQQAVDAGESTVVGVNRYVDANGTPTRSVFRIDPDVERQQIERVRAVRAGRSESTWRPAIERVEAAARGSDNLLPPILSAVEAYATLGEISDAMRRVFGEHAPPTRQRSPWP